MGALSPFGNRKVKISPQPYKAATISDFSGGLNGVDNDVTMKSKFAKILDNWNKNVDGSLSVRWGNKFKYDVASVVTGSIIEVVYFNSHLVVFMTTGQVAKVTEAGVVTAIWNTAIAAALVGAPAAWSTGLAIGSIDTTEFKGELTAQNGIDKPIKISSALVVGYQQDPATGSNVYTPIGKYITTVANYTVVAGIAGQDGVIYISSQGTAGVWPGDTAPNNSLSFNVSTYVPSNSKEIIGLGSFRNNLIVIFEGAIVIVQLGTYAAAVHTPIVQDNIIEHGTINFRTMITTKNDFIMADILGWHTASKNQFGLVTTDNISELIDPLYQKTTNLSVADRKLAFSVRNGLEHRITTFVPNGNGTYTGWTLTHRADGLKNIAWNKVSGWSFTSGCVSQKGRVFLAKETKIYQYGNEIFTAENYTADNVGEYSATWATAQSYAAGTRVLNADGNVYTSLVTHTSTVFAADQLLNYWSLYEGEDISFDWELPWTDINARANKKSLAYIMADTNGTAQFTMSFFNDNYYKDTNLAYTPVVQLGFVGGDSNGFGNNDQPFGGGRRLRDERPWGTPVDFKLLKIRIHGATKKALKFITLTILYRTGSFKR